MKIYRNHNCEVQHRTYRAMAKCCWPKNIWVSGEGPYATVSYCWVGRPGRYITVALHKDLADAELSLRVIDDSYCGGSCSRNHALVKLVLPTKKEATSIFCGGGFSRTR